MYKLKTKVVSNLALQSHLFDNGFRHYKEAQDRLNTKRVVWLYYKNEDFQKCCDEFYATKSKKVERGIQ